MNEIRTLAEIQSAGRFTVTVTVEPEVEDLEKNLTLVTTSRNFNRAEVLKLREQVAELTAQRDGFDQDRKIERARADRAATSAEEARNALAEANIAIERIHHAVYTGGVDDALGRGNAPLANAVSKVRDALNQ